MDRGAKWEQEWDANLQDLGGCESRSRQDVAADVEPRAARRLGQRHPDIPGGCQGRRYARCRVPRLRMRSQRKCRGLSAAPPIFIPPPRRSSRTAATSRRATTAAQLPLRHSRARHGIDHFRHGACRMSARSARPSSSSPTTCVPPIRLAAMMQLPVIYIYTHDSIGLGEDGPTHQSIEQLAVLPRYPAHDDDSSCRRERDRRSLARPHADEEPAGRARAHSSSRAHLRSQQVCLGRGARQRRVHPRRFRWHTRDHPDRAPARRCSSVSAPTKTHRRRRESASRFHAVLGAV